MADKQYFDQAAAHIDQANVQIKDGVDAGKVAGSLMFASARFNIWLVANNFPSSEAMKATKAEHIAHFLKQYEVMLNDNLDDYIENYNEYMLPKTELL